MLAQLRGHASRVSGREHRRQPAKDLQVVLAGLGIGPQGVDVPVVQKLAA